MAHFEDRWMIPTDQLDTRGRVIKKRSPRYGIGKRWMAAWTESGKRRSELFDNKDQALGKIAEVKKAQSQGRHINAHKMTVGEFGDQWITTQIHQRPSTAATMRTRWFNLIRPAIGDLLLTEVTPMHTQAMVLRWLNVDELAHSTINVAFGYTSGMFRAAVRQRLRIDNPCEGIHLPNADPERVVPLTTEQVITIADRITPRYRSLVLLGAATGMRSGELTGLTVDRLKWGAVLTIRIDRQLTSNTPTWGPPKTKHSDRSLTVDDTAAGMLQYHMLRYPPHESGLIFTGDRGGPCARGSMAKSWINATEGMGLPERSGLHALRHYHASLLIAAGVSVTAVADRLGHQDSSVTLRIYSHLWPDDEERSRDAIARGLWA